MSQRRQEFSERFRWAIPVRVIPSSSDEPRARVGDAMRDILRALVIALAAVVSCGAAILYEGPWW